MSPQPIQNTIENIIAIANPNMQTIQFSLAMVNLALMSQLGDIDYSNDYRNALVYIKESLELQRDTLETNKKVTNNNA
ncbi:hypothetical protein [Pseudanabaena sp. 'Roaring Creek']|uniref:hypothetical protein n=1 Tax=Pseudanabaena sp. 'Roaring Creek' TaxID=1681830 RepID=UPI0006D7888E|nr:hypothetical protein [Pseudanabaena sp. 'Roaring Creek']